jgi:hypothetical protein
MTKNGQKTNYNLQNTTQKTKDQTNPNKMGATSGAGIVYLSFPEHMGSSLFFMGFV